MGAIMAKAMNSTVGTDKFFSFDELLFQQKTIVSSENLLYEFGGSAVGTAISVTGKSTDETIPNNKEKEIFSLKILCSGNFDVKSKVGSQDGRDNVNSYVLGGLRIYKNGSLVTTVTVKSPTTGTGQYAQELTMSDITVSAGDEISVRLYVESHIAYDLATYTGTATLLAPVCIYGTLKDTCFKTLSQMEG